MARPTCRLAATMLAGVALLVACDGDGSDVSSPVPSPLATTEPPSSVTTSPTTAASPVALVSVEQGVSFYPACGNETLEHRGVTWSPIVQVGFEPMMPELQDRVDAVLAVDREPWSPAKPEGLARVAPPGPGDDVGTLAIWADGVARWSSDSGDLDVWMVDDEIGYLWVC